MSNLKNRKNFKEDFINKGREKGEKKKKEKRKRKKKKGKKVKKMDKGIKGENYLEFVLFPCFWICTIMEENN